MSESSGDISPLELKEEEVSNADILYLLPEKSREKYLKTYELFNDWRLAKGAETCSENLILSYFKELSETRQPSTLWSIYSMLKATMKTKDVHLEKYNELMAFLKKKSAGHKSQKSRCFTAQNIEQFLSEAPDYKFLASKVVLIIGISGACRAQELLNLTVNNIEKHSEQLILINLPNETSKVDRTFVIRGEYVNIVEKYMALRPTKINFDRFFLQYRDNKCSRQPMGINKIGGLPKEIARFLKLPEPQLYTGHCFRRTAAALLADSGVSLTNLKRHRERKPSTVAESDKEDSVEMNSKISKCFIESIDIDIKQENPWSPPPIPKEERETESRSVSPESLPESTKKETTFIENVTNTTITVPKKNVTFNLKNCSNVTFNF